MKGIVERLLQMPWEDYITSPIVDQNIQLSIQLFGGLYALCAVVVLLIDRVPAALRKLLLLGGSALVFLAALYCKERFFSVGQFLEYSLQFSSPFVLYYLYSQRQMSKRLEYVLRWATAFTFTCHGLYALNYYPRPGLFVEMTMNILSVGEEGAFLFLNAAGLMDIVISMAIISLPGRNKLLHWALIYAVIWGLLTSLARIWAHLYIDFIGESLAIWLPEMIYRFPHFMLPFALYLHVKHQAKVPISLPS